MNKVKVNSEKIKTALSNLYYIVSSSGAVIAAAAVLFVLACICDFATNYDMFSDLGTSDMSIFISLSDFSSVEYNPGLFSPLIIYSLMFVMVLEGTAGYFGKSVGCLFDKTEYKSGRKAISVLSGIVSLLLLSGAFAIIVALRLRIIDLLNASFEVGLIDAYELQQKITVQYGLMFMPGVTSVLVFISGLSAHKANSAEALKKKADHLHEQYQTRQVKYQNTLNSLFSAKVVMWNSLFTNSEPIPEKLDDFRNRVIGKIRLKLADDVIAQYPIESCRFNSRIEAEIDSYIQAISKNCYLEDGFELRTLTAEVLFDRYDKTLDETDKANSWNCSNAKAELKAALKDILDNAVPSVA